MRRLYSIISTVPCTRNFQPYLNVARNLTRPTNRISILNGSIRNFSDNQDDELVTRESVYEKLRKIDTTLTEEQRKHVEKLKKSIRGSSKAPRSMYRDVPTPEELRKVFGVNPPVMYENAQALIDYGLSFIPPRAGPRGSLRKKRMKLRLKVKQEESKKIKAQRIAAHFKRQEKAKKQNIMCKEYRKIGAKLREEKLLKSVQ